MIDQHLRLPRTGTRTLIVSLDSGLRRRLQRRLAAIGCRGDEVSRPARAAQHLMHLNTDAVLLDLECGNDEAWGSECRALLSHDVVRGGGVPVVVLADSGGMASATRMVEIEAADSVSRSSSDDQIVERLALAICGGRDAAVSSVPRQTPGQHRETAESGADDGCPTGLLLGQSAAMRDVLARIRMVAGKQTTVLIMGETGTGKECVARAIHALGPNAAREMVSVNCAGIPSNLLEDEFFGHVKGAFTDAHQARVGRFEQASGSSIFLDEIGELPIELQLKLLRVLQEREIHRIGGADTIPVNARVICATNADLWGGVDNGTFREDLFYRINVFPIQLPPLRERREDIPLFLRHFLDRFCRREGLPLKTIDRRAEAELMTRRWPGNIRELENAVEMAVILSGDRAELSLSDFPEQRRPAAPEPTQAALLGAELSYKTLVEQFERDLISRVLVRTGSNKTLAADVLRLNRTTLVEKWKKLQQGPEAWAATA